MPKREHQADGHRALAVLYELACDVINCRNMICIDSMTEPKAISKQGGPEKNGVIVKGNRCPKLKDQGEGEQEAVDANDPSREILSSFIDPSI
jgi:hypothetical protein